MPHPLAAFSEGWSPPNGYLELLSLHDLIFGVIGKKWYLVMRGAQWERERETDRESI